MILDCILDTCPKDGQFVNHLKCCKCDYNPLGDGQPQFGRQLCDHPQARHEPDHERWEAMKSCGAATLAVTLVRLGRQ